MGIKLVKFLDKRVFYKVFFVDNFVYEGGKKGKQLEQIDNIINKLEKPSILVVYDDKNKKCYLNSGKCIEDVTGDNIVAKLEDEEECKDKDIILVSPDNEKILKNQFASVMEIKSVDEEISEKLLTLLDANIAENNVVEKSFEQDKEAEELLTPSDNSVLINGSNEDNDIFQQHFENNKPLLDEEQKQNIEKVCRLSENTNNKEEVFKKIFSVCENEPASLSIIYTNLKNDKLIKSACKEVYEAMSNRYAIQSCREEGKPLSFFAWLKRKVKEYYLRVRIVNYLQPGHITLKVAPLKNLRKNLEVLHSFANKQQVGLKESNSRKEELEDRCDKIKNFIAECDNFLDDEKKNSNELNL